MKKILVTGSAGMLGTDLLDVLASDFEIYGMCRSSSSCRALHDKLIFLDLTDKSSLQAEILRVKPDVVIHAAAFTKVDFCEDPAWQDNAKKQNLGIVESLVDICNQVNALLIFFSTDYVFSGDQKEPYHEEDVIAPVNFYGQTKAWAETAIQSKSNRYIIFRITWLYGRNGNHFPGAILKQAPEKNEIAVVSDQWGRPTWTRDVAFVLRDLLTSRKNLLDQYNKEIFHIGNTGQVNWSGYARHILDRAGFANVRIKPISSLELNRAAKRPMNSVLNLDKADRLLGIKMRPWQEALNEFLTGLKDSHE